VLRLAGFAVHLFTALGSVCALLAMLAIFERAYEMAFVWLFVALVIDTVDGTLARAVDIHVHVPRFSGERLDLVIDYITYVFVPVIALMHAGFLSGIIGGATGGLILLSALYHFADTGSKADDNCFVGFPAVWNIVAFCLFAWSAPGWLAVGVSLVLVALAFVPMHWIHPMRVVRHFWINVAMAAAGVAAGIWILATGFPAGVVPGAILAAASLYFVGMALIWPRLNDAANDGPR